MPENVVPNININKNNLWILVVNNTTPYAIVLKIIVIIKIGLLPYVSEYGGRIKKLINMPTI